MTIDFEFFETDSDEVVNIYDGDNADAPLIASLYGNYTAAARPPTGYRSTQPNVYVTFVSDGTTKNFRGFSATYAISRAGTIYVNKYVLNRVGIQRYNCV